MEEVKQIPKPVLTADDHKRIQSCDFYAKAKEIIAGCKEYKEYEVGAAVYVVRKNDGKMVSSDYEGKNPEKFLIVHNEDGFVFAKRFNANGKPSVAIICLTIDYPSSHYTLKVDDGYIESMLLDTQDEYDPSAEAKNLAKRKNKASRDNQKIRIQFETGKEAYDYIQNLKIGDKLWGSDYSYGSGVTEYLVDSIDKRAVGQTKTDHWGRSYNYDSDYTSIGATEVISIKLKAVSSSNKYLYDRTLTFNMLSKAHSGQYYFFFPQKPISPDDVAK